MICTGEFEGHEYAAWGDRVRVGIELGVTPRGRHVHRPMAGAGDVCLAALLDALKCSDLASRLVVRAAAGAHELLELVVKAFGAEIALLLGDPLLQTEMRLDDELGHSHSPFAASRRL